MKANAPDKIYLYPYSTDGIYEVETKPLEGTIEYIRADAFIEKAAKWLEDNAIEYWGTEAVDNGMMIVEFKKAMKL